MTSLNFIITILINCFYFARNHWNYIINSTIKKYFFLLLMLMKNYFQLKTWYLIVHVEIVFVEHWVGMSGRFEGMSVDFGMEDKLGSK